MEAEAVSNDVVLENESAGVAEEKHATNEEAIEEIAEQVEVEEEELKQDKVIEEVLIS